MPSSNPSDSFAHVCSKASWYLQGEGYEEHEELTGEIGQYLNSAYNCSIKEAAQEQLEKIQDDQESDHN